MPWSDTQYFTVSTFQSADGSNFTTAGYDIKFKHGLATYVGMGTDFESEPIGVIDLKESNPYVKGSIFTLSQNVRIRTKYDDKPVSTQFRVSPATITHPFKNGKTSISFNAHYAGTYNYQDKGWNHSAGAFLTLTHKFNDTFALSAEGQRYNLQNIFSDNSGKNWSGNLILSVKLP